MTCQACGDQIIGDAVTNLPKGEGGPTEAWHYECHQHPRILEALAKLRRRLEVVEDAVDNVEIELEHERSKP